LNARKYASTVPAGVVLATGAGLVFFIIALISGATFALALALGAGGGFGIGALYAARQNPERLLPLACVAGAGALFASELMTTFQLSATSSAGPEFCNVAAAGRHHFALGVLAIFAVIAVLVAVTSASKPAAMAVGVAGVIALILFLTIDLPHANNTGTLGACSTTAAQNFFDAKAVPQAGFWLEMVGALALALSGVALGTLNPDQLRAIRPGWLPGATDNGESVPKAAASSSPLIDPDAEPMAGSSNDRDSRAARRARARGSRRS
jgi:hypothetical protein